MLEMPHRLCFCPFSWHFS